jgi:homocysteine S-methyltransferase
MRNFESIMTARVVLTEGSMVERIRRASEVELDPFVSHAGLVYSESGRAVLKNIYTEYIDIGRKYRLPFIALAPTWRANPERVAKSQYAARGKDINRDCVEFVHGIRKTYGDYSSSIWIGGLMACRGDAYRPQESLARHEAVSFHRQQAAYLASSGIDFIRVATLPAAPEALGLAEAIAPLNLPYILSFVVRPSGTLLDDTPLSETIELIDASVEPRPLFYTVNCVHPLVFESAMKKTLGMSEYAASRIRGFQANTSTKSPEELDGLPTLETAEPTKWAEQIVSLHHQFRLVVLGGCCGTDGRHIAEIAKRLTYSS